MPSMSVYSTKPYKISFEPNSNEQFPLDNRQLDNFAGERLPKPTRSKLEVCVISLAAFILAVFALSCLAFLIRLSQNRAEIAWNKSQSCRERCNIGDDGGCQCTPECVANGNCCADYTSQCPQLLGPITDDELASLSEELFNLEGPNNVANYVTLNPQGKSNETTEDMAQLPLLKVDRLAYQSNTIALLVALHDNYEKSVEFNENVTSKELLEENAFIDAIFATKIFQKLLTFLTSKGFELHEAKFREMWFGLYSRPSGSGVLSSSGFEHVFLGELTSNVSGLHNWIFFANQEEVKHLNYFGWMKHVELGPKGDIMQHTFQWFGQNKTQSSMFIGTSPEFEMAVYSLCWMVRPNSTCSLSFGGVKVPIMAYTIGDNEQFVGSAYPIIV